ncbi:hypothetical protein GCM10011399_14940 [Subtercola lobariae]|uniref:Uncharacterized protein n=1 Tax=Subtercola lobariae TaxID=1588641 RepID=A0A917B416_9MICO|nr:hypothetical protein GCM10011399_14940 [Subtercola lobariae]
MAPLALTVSGSMVLVGSDTPIVYVPPAAADDEDGLALPLDEHALSTRAKLATDAANANRTARWRWRWRERVLIIESRFK